MSTFRPMYTFKEATSQEDVEKCHQIRIQVFVHEQGFPLEDEEDEYDAEAKHFLLTTSDLNVENFAGTDTKAEAEKPKCHDLPIGVIRYVSSKQKLTRLAILPAYRNLGLSRVLVQGLEEYVKNSLQGKEVNWFNIRCHSQLQAIPIYEKLGYVKEGAEFDEEGAPHQLMIHRIKIN
ncbi:hypothetical protein L204_101792 [Cryptococcus depauperatus]